MVRMRLATAISPQHLALRVMGGEFNWVCSSAERVSSGSMAASEQRDAAEEKHFCDHVAKPRGLRDMHQNGMTFRSSVSSAKLDRIYCNQHITEQLDRSISCTTLEWRTELSDHRPVIFSRRLPHRTSNQQHVIPATAYQHDDFL